ncbi:MAG: NAD(P)H-dependent oxidoreductase subunit E [Nitrospirae bacterium]|nr:MAG: NAD(P)H-dependent oxidoreductase subunit E [Nitrospirota bacterium]
MKEKLNKILQEYKTKEANIIYLLQETEEVFGYIPREAVDYFAEELSIAPSRFYGVATFYAQFHLNPRGKHVITACCGTACHVKGSERLINGLRMELGLAEGHETTADMEFTLEKVNCVGACSIAPVFIINKKVYGKSTSDRLIKEVRSMKEAKQADA